MVRLILKDLQNKRQNVLLRKGIFFTWNFILYIIDLKQWSSNVGKIAPQDIFDHYIQIFVDCY